MQMKQIITFLFFVSISLYANSQNEEKIVSLGEVTIQGSRVVKKVDGQTIYPTAVQKSASNDGYSILNKLSLPNIRIDEV